MERKARQSTKKKPTANISSAHFVGYVEDDESVEAIMKKFAAMEEYERELKTKTPQPSQAQQAQHEGGSSSAASSSSSSSSSAAAAAAAAAAATALPAAENSEFVYSDAQLEEIFKRTSSFSVKSASLSNIVMDETEYVEALLGEEFDEAWQRDSHTNGDALSDEEFSEYWMDDGDDEAQQQQPAPSNKRKSRSGGEPHVRDPAAAGGRNRNNSKDRQKIIDRYKVLQFQMQDRMGNLFTVRRRVQQTDPSVPTYVRVPPDPIPSAWCITIPPLAKTLERPKGSRYYQADVLNLGEKLLADLGGQYQAIYMDPPLLLPNEQEQPGKISMAQLSKLPIPQLCSNGFLFVWIEKENIHDFITMAEGWKFRCVENICWIRMTPNHKIAREPSAYFNKSKLTMLVLRRDGEIELRHQRSPDSFFDFVRSKVVGTVVEERPPYVYEAIETLLPQAIYNATNNANGTRLLQLWAPQNAQRTGWTIVSHRPVTVV